ncbi:Serine-threonine/tyrosine-protein kinase catalytic domain, partial [Arabidopsis thaliana x Arabidopsis arenosa]
MNNLPTSCLVLFFLFFLFHPLPWALSKEDLGWCEALFQCGNITAGFPFWGGNRPKPCGHPLLELRCLKDVTSLNILNHEYNVFDIDQTSNTLRLARTDLLGSFCSAEFITTTFPREIFKLSPTYKSLNVLYHCDPKLSYRSSYTCPDLGLFSMSQTLDYQYSCQDSFTVNVPTSFVPEEKDLNLTHLESALREGFEVKLMIDEIPCQECSSTRGICGFNSTTQICCNVTSPSGGVTCVPQHQPSADLLKKRCSKRFSCGNQRDLYYPFWIPGREYCGHPDFKLDCSRGFAEINIASVKFRILNMSYGSSIIRLARSDYIGDLCPPNPLNEPLIENVLQFSADTELLTLYYDCQLNSSVISTTSYIGELGCDGGRSYYVTKNLSSPLLDRGTLNDGRVVAVKVLKESKGNNSEDFINEVSSMSQTSHVNIVSLLGFCSEGSKRAIIYEFLENGSLDKFISEKTSVNLDLTTLYGIALGVARGLEYLHYGCKTRIVHFDIKPQNVLLDDNLSPKVSDFGLAKLCEKKESVMSLMDTRGTIGYIAPEMISRVYGSVSHKSDVYSYGMLVFEMIGARKKERFGQNSTSNECSMYFPEWIYKDLEKADSEDLEKGKHIENGISSEEEEITKKMTLVGLWCIQSSPSDRPPMNKVVEMMEGSLDTIEVPPRPVLQQIPVVPLLESSWISEEGSTISEIENKN